MLRAMDSAVAGLRAHQSKLDVIGHNIANVNTVGFKSQSYTFKEAMYQTSSASTGGTETAAGSNAAQYGYGSMTGSISMDMTASTPTYVSGFNASIDGQGFFLVCPDKVDIPNDDTLKAKASVNYTRVGAFSIDSNGYVVDQNNNFVFGFQPDDTTTPTKYDATILKALRIPDKTGAFTDKAGVSTNVQINKLGVVTAEVDDGNGSTKTYTLGKVAIATFQNPEGLTKSGGYYYTTKTGDNAGDMVASEPGSKTAPTLMTGFLEGSNVDMAKEFSELITTQRGFQANTKIITVSDEILNELVNMKR